MLERKTVGFSAAMNLIEERRGKERKGEERKGKERMVKWS